MLNIVDRRYEPTKVAVTIIFHGPGPVTLFCFDGSFGRLHLFHANTPTDYVDFVVEFLTVVARLGLVVEVRGGRIGLILNHWCPGHGNRHTDEATGDTVYG